MATDDAWIAFFVLLTVAAGVAVVVLWALALASRAGGAAGELFAQVRDSLGRGGLAVAALVAATATAGSLYLSEGAGFIPCELCWYQRIAVYSTAAILVLAAIRRDWAVRPYAVLLCTGGALISVYHYLEQHFPDLGGTTCDPENPCSLRYVWELGFVSIPWMALSAQLLVVTVLLVARPGGAGEAEPQEQREEQPDEQPDEHGAGDDGGAAVATGHRSWDDGRVEEEVR